MGKYKKIAGVYVITNIHNNKKYIGSSMNIKKRWANHKFHLRRNTSKNRHLQNAWNKYGENAFAFSILEIMPPDLTKMEYESREADWVLKFNTHLSEYGYNACIPGDVHTHRGEHRIAKGKRKLINYVCINSSSGEIIRLSGRQAVTEYTGIPINKVTELSCYWKAKTRKKSLHNWMVVKEDEYEEEFDYINWKKERRFKYGRKLSDGEYYQIRKKEGKVKYEKRNIIPYGERQLKRIGVVAVDVLTGEEAHYRCINDTRYKFLVSKVRKCINNPFGKYQHRGCYFRKNI